MRAAVEIGLLYTSKSFIPTRTLFKSLIDFLANSAGQVLPGYRLLSEKYIHFDQTASHEFDGIFAVANEL